MFCKRVNARAEIPTLIFFNLNTARDYYGGFLHERLSAFKRLCKLIVQAKAPFTREGNRSVPYRSFPKSGTLRGCVPIGSSVALKFCHPAAKMLATRIIHRNSKVSIVLLIKNLMFFDN